MKCEVCQMYDYRWADDDGVLCCDDCHTNLGWRLRCTDCETCKIRHKSNSI